MIAKKRFFAVCLIFAVLLSLCSCSKKEANVKDVISAISARYQNSPAGKVYFSEAEIGEDEYMSDSLVSALFGNGTTPVELQIIDSWALRISSFTTPFEYAVFKAKTINDTDEIAAMCYRRINTIQSLLNRNGTDAEKSVANSATVYITGKFVLLIMTDDNETVLDIAKSELR